MLFHNEIPSIPRYTPQSIELEHKLKPFIPDFIPAVGDIDAFIKVIAAFIHTQTLKFELSGFKYQQWKILYPTVNFPSKSVIFPECPT